MNQGDTPGTLPGGGDSPLRGLAEGAMSSPQDPPNPSERFLLPDSFASAGDPVDGNPFPVDDPFHTVWSGATRKAEEEVCHITSSALPNLTSNTAFDWPASIIVAKFDAWAQRGALVVWSDRALQHYDQWLVAYANAWLDAVTLPFLSAPPTPAIGRLLLDLRNRLGAQVHVWKAVARRMCVEQQSARSSHRGLPPDAARARFFDTFLRDNPFTANHPGHHQWIETSRHLAAELARIESALWSARPSPADATTLIESLASWTAVYFDALAQAHLIVVVTDKGGEAGLEAYKGVLEGLRVQALKAADTLQARVSGHAQTLMAAFPGATTSNAACVAFVAEVNERLIPEVTPRLSRRKAERWLQACTMARAHNHFGVRDTSTSPAPARGVEAVPDGLAAPRTDPRVFTATPDREAEGPAHAREPVTAPPHGPTSARGWEDIEIRFLSDLKFQAVVNGKVQEPQNYADAGFGDGRRGNDAPKAAWDTLRRLAESHGVLSSADSAAEWGRVEKHIQEIRQRLRAQFKLDGDPVPYISGGYRTRFTISTSASYEQ